MRRRLKLAALSALLALVGVLGLVASGLAGEVRPMSLGSAGPARVQDPAPAPAPPPAAARTCGDLVKDLASAVAARSAARASRDSAARALEAAETLLRARVDSAVAAEARLASAVQAGGPVMVDGVVYEPAGDGKYRTYRPRGADTPLPAPPPAG